MQGVPQLFVFSIFFFCFPFFLTSSPFSMLVSVQGGYVSVYTSRLNLERRGHTDLMKLS